MDSRLKLLATIAAIAAVAILGSFAWAWWTTCASCQFGDPAAWPEHVTDINNIAFRYPPGFDIIVPDNETENPVSIVKEGERGESVLIQVGTWRADRPFTAPHEVADRYEQAVSRRTTVGREFLSVDNREGVLLVQDEPSGRRIIEAFFLDSFEEAGPEEPKTAREISLQLPGTASAVERELYEGVFRELIASLDFLRGPEDAYGERPEGLPKSWKEYVSESAGFALWHAPDWIVSEREDNDGSVVVTFVAPGTTATYAVRVLPPQEEISLNALDARFSQELLGRAAGDSLSSSSFGLPGFGPGISYEARVPKEERADSLLFTETTNLTYLTVLVAAPSAMEEDNPQGRGYVLEALMSGGAQQERVDSAHVRRMTQTLHPVNPGTP